MVIRNHAAAAAAFVLGVAVASGGIAAAATGGALTLGHANSAGKTTSLKNTGSGATLALVAGRSGQAPLAVSSNAGKAKNLNADKLDGFDSSAFARTAGKTGGKQLNASWFD